MAGPATDGRGVLISGFIRGTAAAICLLALCVSAHGQECSSETEPNDQPGQEAAFEGMCAEGTVGGEDGQDLWRWSVTDAGTPQQISVDGVSNALTRVQLFTVRRNSAGNVLSQNVLLQFDAVSGTEASVPFMLAPGDYFIGVASAGRAGNYRLQLSSPDLPSHSETEPNDDEPAGETLGGAFSLRANGDTDRFAWALDDGDAKQRWRLQHRAPLGARYNIDLLDNDGRRLTSRMNADAGVRSVSDIALDAGTYTIVVKAQGESAGTPYVLEAVAMGPRSASAEEEPNDRNEPYPMNPAIGMTGTLDGDPTPTDFFVFENAATRPGQRTAIELRTESRLPRTLCLHDATMREIQCRSGARSVSLPDLVLTDKRYLLHVQGGSDADAPYALTFTSTSVYGALYEQEPNDAFWHAPPLDERNSVRGRFDGTETDVYKFRVPGPEQQLWRVQVTGDGLRRLEVQDARGDVIAAAAKVADTDRIRLSPVLLLPGTHYVSVYGQSGEYRLRALSLGPPDPNVEAEPNDAVATAQSLAFGQTRRGVLHERDNDRYRFRLLNRERIRLTLTPPPDQGVRLRFTPASAIDAPLRTSKPGEPLQLEATLLPGSYGVWLDAQKPSQDAYSVKLERLPNFDAPIGVDAGIDATVSFEQDEVAAFSIWQQRVSGQVSITNNSDSNRTLTLTAIPSDAGVDVVLERDRIRVSRGATERVGISLIVPPDTHVPISLQVGTGDKDRIVAIAEATVTPSSDAEPVAPTFAWSVPEALRGSIDVAAIGLGASVVAPGKLKEADRELQHDQFATEAAHHIASFDLRQSPLPLSLTTRLRGDTPVPVIGIALHPQSDAGTNPANQQVREFELELSADGQSFDSVLRGTLQPLRREQFFELDSPVSARAARLIIRSNHGDTGKVVLDSWKVLAPPDVLGGNVNLADPAVGGHLVYHDLQSWQRHDFAAPASPLVPGAARWQLNCYRDCKPSEFVVGFHSGRAAEIAAIEWVEAAITNDKRIPRVTVSVSTDTPLGPWQTVGTIEPGAGPHGTHVLPFDTPVSARYVRFHMPADIGFPSALPDVVRIIERGVDADYRSILGEWGWRSSVASDTLRSTPVYEIDSGADGNDSAGTAQPLTEPVRGSVRIGVDEDYYRIDVAGDSNTLHIDLGGRPTIGATLELTRLDGTPHSLVVDPDQSSPTHERWVASVTPNTSYVLRVLEPPRSVVFVWDTSGSVAPFRPVIWKALLRFSSGVTPGEEAVNLLPFGVQSLLLEEWQDEPTLILRALQDHQRAIDSSETGETLLGATEALALRSGTRAVVLIGDIAQPISHSPELWQALAAVKPHIYLMRVAHSGIEQQRSELAMRHWAAVNNGDARDTPLADDLEVGFDRAAARLRRPAAYTLSATQEYVQPPGPGKLRVATRLVERDDAAEPTVLGNTAVEIVLDASGSMRQQLGGKRRIDVAKETLSQLVNDVLPAGTPMALRVFGHVEGNYSCRTDLVQPLAPLDPATATEVIAPIQPQHLAATPIAASLRQVADDLAGAAGRKIVILLTDGEETCDGDPAAEIQKLVDRGIDVRLNIVGFALNDAALKATFAEWAKAGGGRFFDAADASALGTAISEALRVPYRVLAEGDEVARGVVNGDAIELPAGEYTIEVLSEPPLRREGVAVLGDRSQTVMVEDSPPRP